MALQPVNNIQPPVQPPVNNQPPVQPPVNNNQPPVQPPVNNNQPPVQPPVNNNPVDPVAVAINKLSKTAIDLLWKEKVTDASWYAKLFGLIGYAWNRSTAAAADKQFGATIEKFNKASAELVIAVADRHFTPQEAAEAGIPEVQFNSTLSQLHYSERLLNSKQKLETFYTLFKERTTQLNAGENSGEFGFYAAAAQKIINDLPLSTDLLNLKFPATLPVRIKTTLHDFNGKIFDDMATGFANQPIADITIESFKQKAAVIKGFFASIDNVDIETKMRQAIKAKHDTAAIDTIRGEFTSTDPNSARLTAAKTAITTQLEAARVQLQTELDALRGSTGFNGTINTAFQERQTAEAEMNQAKAAYVTQRGLYGSAATVSSAIADLLALDDATDPRIIASKADLVVKARTFDEKKRAHEDLGARFREIAQYQQGTNTLNGGKLFEVTANLQPTAVERAARAETARVARFYTELNLLVGDTNKVARSEALHRIIG
jgi:hypothetical protein